MKFAACFFAFLVLFISETYAAESPEVNKCLEIPDADFNAQLDCLDPILAKAKTKLDDALKAKTSSLNGDNKAVKALEKQQKDWKKKLGKTLCPNPGRPQELGYQVACEIEQTNKRTAELSK
jgi:uncharacterized protein YecT (DUF1311 family)